MFVIPCRFDPARPVIFDCVASIRKHHPDADILVVDSNSPDTSYLFDLDCATADIQNDRYGPGAWKYALGEYRAEEFFYLLFDSLTVNANLDDLRSSPLTTVRWFSCPPTGWGWNETTGEPLDDWARNHGVKVPDKFRGVFGPMICASRETIIKANLFRVLPTNRFEQCALERCWGIWLDDAGFDVTNSLQGEMHGFYDRYDETRVAKRTLARD